MQYSERLKSPKEEAQNLRNIIFLFMKALEAEVQTEEEKNQLSAYRDACKNLSAVSASIPNELIAHYEDIKDDESKSYYANRMLEQLYDVRTEANRKIEEHTKTIYAFETFEIVQSLYRKAYTTAISKQDARRAELLAEKIKTFQTTMPPRVLINTDKNEVAVDIKSQQHIPYINKNSMQKAIKEHNEQNKLRAATQVKKTPRFFSRLKLWLVSSWLYLLLTVLFIVAAKPLPTGYYTFLRIFVSVSLSWSVFFDIVSFSMTINNSNETIDIIILALKIIIIILFNTYRPFYFTKSTWIVIDILCAVVMLFISIYKFIVIWRENQIHHKKQNANY